MSQNKFYLTENKDVYQLITGDFPLDSQFVIERNKLIGVLSSHDMPFPLIDTVCSQPYFTQRFSLLGEALNATIIDSLNGVLGSQTWGLSLVTEHLGIKRLDVHLSTELNESMLVELKSVGLQYQCDVIKNDTLPSLSQPGLVVLDMDSTSITIECIDEIAKLAGVGEQVAEITELAMQGKLDFSQSLRSRVSKLKGIEVRLLDSIANELPLMPGMKELAVGFKEHGWRVAIASGGFTYFADNLKNLLGLDEAVSNTLVIEGGKLTGEVSGRIVDAKVKAETVKVLAKKYGIKMSQTIAIGDGANDLAMMDVAALGIAYHAKPIVQQQADIAINSTDLRSVIALLSR